MRINKTKGLEPDAWLDLIDYGGVLTNVEYSVTPTITLLTSKNAYGRENLMGTDYGSRELTLVILVRGKSIDDINKKNEAIAKLMDGVFAMELPNNKGRVYKDVAMDSSISIELISTNSAIITIDLKAFYPFLLSTEEMVYEYSVGSGVHSEVVVSDGTHDSEPLVHLAGDFDKVEITIGNKTMEYRNMHEGSVTIDCENFTVIEDNGVNTRNAIGNWGNNFITIPTGTNELRVDVDGTLCELKLVFRENYL